MVFESDGGFERKLIPAQKNPLDLKQLRKHHNIGPLPGLEATDLIVTSVLIASCARTNCSMLPCIGVPKRFRIAGALSRGESPVMNDYVGFRIFTPHRGLLQAAVVAVRNWAQSYWLFELEFDDKFANPGIAGYCAIHIDYAENDDPTVGDSGIEVQITTWLHSLHAEVTHQLLYKNPEPSVDLVRELSQVSIALITTDDSIRSIYSRD